MPSHVYPTPKLVLLAAVPAALSLVAVVTPMLGAVAWAAWLLVIALASVDLAGCRKQPAPTVTRELPRRARPHEPCVISYRIGVEQPARIAVLDELPADLGGDRQLGAMTLARGEHVVERTVTPERRGQRALGPIQLWLHSPLRLFVRRQAFGPGQTLHVYPATNMKDRKGPTSPRTLQELGIKPRRPRGEGSEFESLREYTIDDEPRRIDWRASARARHPVVRDYHTERNHTLVIAVDCGRLMASHIDGQSKLDHALSAAINLTRASAYCQDRVGFVAFDRELCAWVPPQRATHALPAILEASLPLEARPIESSYRALAETMQARQKKRSLLVVLTDFVEGAGAAELEAYLSALGVRHCVLLVGLRDRLLRELDQAAPDLAGHAVYRRLVLQDLDVARDVAIARISRLGVHTLDLDPAQVTGPLLDRYLQIREAGLL